MVGTLLYYTGSLLTPCLSGAQVTACKGNTSKIHTYIHTYIHTLLRLPSTGLFSHNVNYYIILVINKRKLIYSSLMKFNIHSELFKIYTKLLRMKHIIKKCLLKTINIFSVLDSLHRGTTKLLHPLVFLL